MSVCPPMMGLRTARHNRVVDRLVKALPVNGPKPSLNKRVPLIDSPLKPDIVLFDRSSSAMVIVDVVVCFESDLDSLDLARGEKIHKYSMLAPSLNEKGIKLEVEAFVMGSLGTIHKDNTKAMKALGIPNFKHSDLLKLAVSDVIRGSSEMYHSHVSRLHSRNFGYRRKVPSAQVISNSRSRKRVSSGVSRETGLPLASPPPTLAVVGEGDRQESSCRPLIASPVGPVCSLGDPNGSLVFSPLDPFALEVESRPPVRGTIVKFVDSPVRFDLWSGSPPISTSEDHQGFSGDRLVFSPLDPFAQEISSRPVDLNEDSNDTIVYNNS